MCAIVSAPIFLDFPKFEWGRIEHKHIKQHIETTTNIQVYTFVEWPSARYILLSGSVDESERVLIVITESLGVGLLRLFIFRPPSSL